MVEVSKREKQAGVVPDPDIDAYMKVPLVSLIFFFSLCFWRFQYRSGGIESPDFGISPHEKHRMCFSKGFCLLFKQNKDLVNIFFIFLRHDDS